MSAIEYHKITKSLGYSKNKKGKIVEFIEEVSIIQNINFPDGVWNNIISYLLRDKNKFIILQHLHNSGLQTLKMILKHLGNDIEEIKVNIADVENIIRNDSSLSVEHKKRRTAKQYTLIKLILKYSLERGINYNDTIIEKFYGEYAKQETQEEHLYAISCYENEKQTEQKELEWLWLKNYQVGEEVLIRHKIFHYRQLNKKYLKGRIIKIHKKSIQVGLYAYSSSPYQEKDYKDLNRNVPPEYHDTWENNPKYHLFWKNNIERTIGINKYTNIIKYNDMRYYTLMSVSNRWEYIFNKYF